VSCHSGCAIDCIGTSNTQCLPCPPGSPPDCRKCKNYELTNGTTSSCGACHDECLGKCSGPVSSVTMFCFTWRCHWAYSGCQRYEVGRLGTLRLAFVDKYCHVTNIQAYFHLVSSFFIKG